MNDVQELLKRYCKDINITVAIGLELADDYVLENLYNKGFRVKHYLKAVEVLNFLGIKVRTYVLVNAHPVLHIHEDFHKRVVFKTLNLVTKVSNEVVVINAYPHMKSKLFNDWLYGLWHPLTWNKFRELINDFIDKVEIDFQNFKFRPLIPSEKQYKIVGVGVEQLQHPYYELWHEYLVNFYTPPRDKDILLILPCSYRKPYTKSKTWKIILKKIRNTKTFNRLHIVVISSPGVIPIEFVDEYPFNSYDWPEWLENEYIKKLYQIVNCRRFLEWLSKHHSNYRWIIIYLNPLSETYRLVNEVISRLNLWSKTIPVLNEDDVKDIVIKLEKPIGSSLLVKEEFLNKLCNVLNSLT